MPNAVQTAAMDRLIDRLDRLHSSPHVAYQILAILQDEDYETRELVPCLESDPALATAILRLVNSAYFGLGRNISSLQHAITYLGSRSLRLAVLSFGLAKQFVDGAPAQLYQDFWRRSLTMAAVASRFAVQHGQPAPDEAYSAGLLADVGMLLLAQVETRSYLKMYPKADHSTLLVESEQELYGFDHGQLGARLLQRWNLPDTLTQAVADHHRQSDDDPLVRTVFVANLMSDVLWTPHCCRVHETRQLVEREFGLDMDKFIALAIDCKEIVNDSASIYQVRLGGKIDCQELVKVGAGNTWPRRWKLRSTGIAWNRWPVPANCSESRSAGFEPLT